MMGAVKPSEDHPPGTPNVDPNAIVDESPVHAVTLKPFFFSKYEMTQGQWFRFTRSNPSMYGPGAKFGDKVVDLRHPQEQVSWDDCTDVARKLRLRLPSEAEWEYAARAGTNTVYWTGDEKESLRGAANIADLFCKNNGGLENWPYDEWLDDGYTIHAPVGIYSGNPFGLHDVHGNVYEWCQDTFKAYQESPASDSTSDSESSIRIFRGGGWYDDSRACRSSYRRRVDRNFRHGSVGFRPARSLD
jgi:formylglycine-generating enzyme required for sulfatase activity